MEPQWFFEQVVPGSVERNPVSEEFFTNDTRLEAIIRESIQNSIDARLDLAKPVEVRIYFSGVKDCLPAEKYQRYRISAEERYSDPKSGLVQPIPDMKEDCQYLVIEDFNTTGLTGDTGQKPIHEDAEHRHDWNYYNYFFRENGSTKFGANTLGSWGAGKCVFQRASRLKTSFAFSVRAGYEPRCFVVGKATLQYHRDANLVTWAPDGWFGMQNDPDPNDPNKILKQPIVDAEFIKVFSEDFNITRGDRAGTSIVIPYVHLAHDSDNAEAEFNIKNLARAVLRNFLIAIQGGDLKVSIQVGRNGEHVVVDKSNFENYGEFLPDVNEDSGNVSRLHHELVKEVLNGVIPDSQRFALKSPGDRPYWTKEMFAEDQLKAMQAVLHAKKPMLIRVPVSIRKKDVGGKITQITACFRVLIKRVELPKSLPPAFYRVGLLIDDVSTQPLTSCVAVVLVDRDPLADFLVAAEPPSHSKWNYDTDRVTKGYDIPRSHIQFVSHSVKYILEQIASCDKAANWDPLSDVFGIKKKTDAEIKEGKKPDDERSGDDENQEENDPDTNLPLLTFSVVSGSAKGVRIKQGEGLQKVLPEKFPVNARFVVGYDTLSGISWTKNDFDLETRSGGVSLDVIQGSVKASGRGNVVSLQLFDASPFEVTVSGFGDDRDVAVDKVRYEYKKEE